MCARTSADARRFWPWIAVLVTWKVRITTGHMNMDILIKQVMASAPLHIVAACMGLHAGDSRAAEPSNPMDPCALVTPTDLQAALGKAFTVSGDVDDGETRTCHFDTNVQILHVDVFTANRTAAEFQAEAKKTMLNNATSGDKAPLITASSLPVYTDVLNGRLVVWKNNVSLFIEITEYNSGLSDAQLKSARVKLANIGLARMK